MKGGKQKRTLDFVKTFPSERGSMRTIKIPYHTSTLDLHVDEQNLTAIITAQSDSYHRGKQKEALIREAE